MTTQIFVNLPVKSLRRSVDFFEELGFAFDPKFTDEQGTCMIIGENIFVMLLTEDFFIVLHVVPTGPSSCRMEWLQRDLKASGVEWVPEETTIIRQDRLLLESAQAAYDADGGAFERSVPIDVATFALRKAVHACTLPDWRAELAKLPRRRIVRART